MGLLDMTPQQYGLLAAGLGMMQNSRGKSLGEALGAGGMQGINAITEMQQQQQLQALHQAQMERYQAQAAQENEKLQMERDKRNAMKGINVNGSAEDIVSKLAAIDPEAAIKWKLNQDNAPIQYLPTSQGYFSANLRHPGVEPVMVDGKPLMPAQWDAGLRGKVKAAEQANTIGDYQDAEGRTAPYWKGGIVGQPPQAHKFEFANDENLKAFAQSPEGQAILSGKPAIGQSTADKTTQTETAKNDADLAMIKEKNAQAARKLLNMMNMRFRDGSPASDGMGATIDSLIDSATGSGIGNIRDNAYNFFGATSPGALSASQLDAIHGWLTSNVPRMEGPQSNFDVENYKTMAGKVGDRNVPADQKKAALNAIRDMLSEVAKQAGGAAIPGAHAGQKSASGWKVERAD